MPINKNVFIHESDQAALQALQSIPGFSQVLKACMNAWNEKLMYINNMASNIRISEEQLPQYYHMLLPICEKLGIEVPDLFLELNVLPNSYTSGDTKPFIVITSGLLETLPEELIPTVLAHECGHIVCHHVLYRTMGTLILSGALSFLPLRNIALAPINAAFAYWMRCSEFSADRAAILCDGTADKMIEVCARFAGFDKDIPYGMNFEAFMNQAKEYEEMMKDNNMNKTMEFMMFANRSHPLNAVRAYEAKQWEQSENYTKAREYFEAFRNHRTPESEPLEFSEKTLLGKDLEEVREALRSHGMTNIRYYRNTERNVFLKKNSVTGVKINGRNDFKEGEWTKTDAEVEVTYYLPFSDEEEKLTHPDEVKVPHSASYYRGKPYRAVCEDLHKAGFTDIRVQRVIDADKERNTVANISIEGIEKFHRNDWMPKDAMIVVMYYDTGERFL